MDGRARLIELARPHIERVPVGVLRDMMLDQLARLSGLPVERIQQSLKAPAEAIAEVRQAERRNRVRRRGPAGLAPTSLERLAVSLLLQHPEVANQSVDTAFLADLPGEGPALLRRMLHVISELMLAGDVSMARLLERMRDDGMYPHMEKLTRFDHKKTGDLAAEFAGALLRLKAEAGKGQVEAKARPGMTMEELAEARDKLSAKMNTESKAEKKPH